MGHSVGPLGVLIIIPRPQFYKVNFRTIFSNNFARWEMSCNLTDHIFTCLKKSICPRYPSSIIPLLHGRWRQRTLSFVWVARVILHPEWQYWWSIQGTTTFSSIIMKRLLPLLWRLVYFTRKKILVCWYETAAGQNWFKDRYQSCTQLRFKVRIKHFFKLFEDKPEKYHIWAFLWVLDNIFKVFMEG